MLILHIRKHFRVRATEWLLSGVMLLWGVLLLCPSDTFAMPSYGELARIGSEDAWGWFGVTVGGLRLLVLIINGALRPSPHLRAILAWLSSYFWWQLSLGFYMAGEGGMALALCPLAVVFDVFNAAMAAGDAGEIDARALKKKAEQSHGGRA